MRTLALVLIALVLLSQCHDDGKIHIVTESTCPQSVN